MNRINRSISGEDIAWGHRRRWEDKIKTDIREIRCEIGDWTELAEGKVQ
jgi:hypothetical protein